MVVPTKLYSGHLSSHFSQQQKSRSPKQKVAGMRSMHEKAGLHQRRTPLKMSGENAAVASI